MHTTFRLGIATALGALLAAGCGDGGSHSPPQARSAANQSSHASAGDSAVPANLAKLSDEDRKLAEAQKYCVVEQENFLGSMGTPVKVMVKDQPVFLCCKSCQKKATADPDKTLAAAEALKKRSAGQAR